MNPTKLVLNNKEKTKAFLNKQKFGSPQNTFHYIDGPETSEHIKT